MVSGYSTFDVEDSQWLVTVEMTVDEEWLCINRWDLDNVKHDKTVMVRSGGGMQVLGLTLKSQMLLVLILENDEKECRMVVTDISTGLSLKTIRFGVVNDPMLFYHTPSNGKYVLVSTEGLPDLMSISDIFEKETEPEMWRRQVGGEMVGNDVVVSNESSFRVPAQL